jgi:hypothetical protein
MAAKFSSVKALCSALHSCFAREAISIFSLAEALNFGAVKLDSCFYVLFVPRALSSAVNIVHEIALLQRPSLYSTSCSICWSINLRLSRSKLVAFF